MIEVTARVWIIAENDDAADRLMDLLRDSEFADGTVMLHEQSRREVEQ